MDVKEEDILGKDIENHWYYVTKGKVLLDFLGSLRIAEVLDVGGGSGIFSKILLDAGICQSAICIDPAYSVENEERYSDRSIRFVRSVHEVNQSLILMMDVLEHVADDLELIREYTASMRPGGKVVVTVPAFNFLWSPHDVFLEHKRRYTLKKLEETLEKSGLKVLRGRYFFGSLLPLVVMMRLMSRWGANTGLYEAKSSLKRHAPIVNHILTLTHELERFWLLPVNRLAGLSIFCLAEKPMRYDPWQPIAP